MTLRTQIRPQQIRDERTPAAGGVARHTGPFRLDYSMLDSSAWLKRRRP